MSGQELFKTEYDRNCHDLILPLANPNSHSPVIGGISVDISDILCILIPNLVHEGLLRLAKEIAPTIPSGPPSAERPELRARLLDQLEKLEIEEESIIDAAERIGWTGFHRRVNCRPDIVLMTEEAI